MLRLVLSVIQAQPVIVSPIASPAFVLALVIFVFNAVRWLLSVANVVWMFVRLVFTSFRPAQITISLRLYCSRDSVM